MGADGNHNFCLRVCGRNSGYPTRERQRKRMDILDRIRQEYSSLSKTRRRISDYILDNASKCCFYSLKEFSSHVEATEATVLNYCRGLGLGSFVDLKKELQIHMLSTVALGDRVKMASSQSGSIAELYGRVIKSEREALRATFEQNSLAKLQEFNCLLRGAKRVFAAGHNASRLPVQYFIQRMVPLGVDVCELDLQDKHQIFSRLSAQLPDDCLVVAFAMSPYGAATVALTEYCHQVGIRVAAVTDSSSSPAAKNAQAVILCHTEFMGLTNSSTSIMAIINLISMLYSFESGGIEPTRQEHLDNIVKKFDQFFN